MNYIKMFIANGNGGPGNRVYLFVSDYTCYHEGRSSQDMGNFQYGTPFTDKSESFIMESLASEHVRGLTIYGGEPMEPYNQERLIPLLEKIRASFPQKSIWIYTNYILEDLIIGGRYRSSSTDQLLSLTDVLVDGKFVQVLEDNDLVYHRSRNQRILNVKLSLQEQSPIWFVENNP